VTASSSSGPRPTRRERFQPSIALDRLGLGGTPLALGLAGVGGAWGPVDAAVGLDTVRLALEKGVEAFDAAPSYGTAERLLGAALSTWRGPRPVISTKVGRKPARDGLEIKFDYTPASMRSSLERSLELLQVPQVDLLFLHEPEFVPREERARVVATLRQLQADGLARRLGLAGGHGEGWDGYIESGGFDVVMLFRRLDPCIFDGLAADVPRARAAGLATYEASPLHMGLLGSRYDEFMQNRPDWLWPKSVERAVRLRALAERSGLTLPELAHRFVFGAAEIDRVVIGARNPAELLDALAAWRAGPLPAELFDAVCAIQD
jgi:aryl-alcohol dehydrogenase-like predicted oxidoreductase